jgi:hypothetical protein
MTDHISDNCSWLKRNLVVFLIFCTVSLLVGMRIWRERSDPFRFYVNRLERAEDFRTARNAASKIFELGPAVVPRLVAEVSATTNTQTRGLMYSLICELDVSVYQQMAVKACRSGDPEMWVILEHPAPEKIILLPENKLNELTNVLSETLMRLQDPVKKKCIEDFQMRLAFEEKSMKSSMQQIFNPPSDPPKIPFSNQ